MSGGVLMPIDLPHYHCSTKHPHWSEAGAILAQYMRIFVDGEEVKEVIHFDRVNGFVAYHAKNAAGKLVIVGKGNKTHFRIARRKGVITVFADMP